jgi:CheY-like chemotaxis protein
MLLKGRKIDCDFAENGQEAVETVAENGGSYQLIFMDFTMPILVSSITEDSSPCSI